MADHIIIVDREKGNNQVIIFSDRQCWARLWRRSSLFRKAADNNKTAPWFDLREKRRKECRRSLHLGKKDHGGSLRKEQDTATLTRVFDELTLMS